MRTSKKPKKPSRRPRSTPDQILGRHTRALDVIRQLKPEFALADLRKKLPAKDREYAGATLRRLVCRRLITCKGHTKAARYTLRPVKAARLGKAA